MRSTISITARNKRIWNLAMSGHSYNAIGREHGLSGKQVNRICCKILEEIEARNSGEPMIDKPQSMDVSV